MKLKKKLLLTQQLLYLVFFSPVSLIISSFIIHFYIIKKSKSFIIFIVKTISILHTSIHLRKLVDNICCLLEKQTQQLLLCYEGLIFYSKANYHLNWIWFSWNIFQNYLVHHSFFQSVSINQFGSSFLPGSPFIFCVFC